MNCLQTQPAVVTTKVVKVNGIDPDVWLKQPGNVYVGRQAYLRSGCFQGSSWPNSGLGNPFRFEKGDTDRDKIQRLFTYCGWLKNQIEEYPFLRNKFYGATGRTFGCWCVNWDGVGDVPLCHAAWMSRILEVSSSACGCMVTDRGEFLPVDPPRVIAEGTVVFTRTKLWLPG